MKLPETDNAHYHYAFKKGYRLALDGKPQSHMPSQIRQDSEMRAYFQMGWEQLHEELKNGEEDRLRTPWRQKTAWYLMMLLAGIGTASVMISQKNEAQQQQQFKIDHPQTAAQKQPGLVISKPKITAESLSLTSDTEPAKTEDAHTAHSPTPPVNKKQQKAEIQTPDQGLSLLSLQQRQDLQQTQQAQTRHLAESQIELSPIVSSPIQVKQAQLGKAIDNKQLIEPFDEVVPKYIRQVAFLTEIEQAQNQTIYHRWVYKNQIMATVALKIDSARFRTWSTKRLTSAWEGPWRIEVLNADKEVIFRHHFRYVQ